MNPIEQHIRKLNTLPNLCNDYLKKIRAIDLEAKELEAELAQKQAEFLESMKKSQKSQKIDGQIRERLVNQCKQIKAIQKKVFELGNSKVKTAQQLYDLVHEPTETLDEQLNQLKLQLQKANKLGSHEEQESNSKKKGRLASKRAGKSAQRRGSRDSGDFQKHGEPKYCYCELPSYGEMVMCENRLCEREWFHIDCILEKNLPEKWYCFSCRHLKGGRGKTKATGSTKELD